MHVQKSGSGEELGKEGHTCVFTHTLSTSRKAESHWPL